MAKLKIIVSATSLFCTRIEWALKLKGLEYELTVEDWDKGKSELLLKSNPVHKKVPVLLDNGVVIAESKVILEYIDEKWKGGDLYPLLPQYPYERAQARFWAQFADDKMTLLTFSPGYCLFCVLFAFGAYWAEDALEKEKAVETALESFAYLEKLIEGKKFSAGDKIGYLARLLISTHISHIHSCTHTQHFIEIPLIKECVPPRDMLVNYWTFI
ncbi:hypothetical protein ACJRO7_007422 [Eucalyptus globulus]|uniref:Glutathione S-transferase n=1 Tax=Eucalyptus globulus TaxID=34317 RepID=A0ABD3INN3_EUCGL